MRKFLFFSFALTFGASRLPAQDHFVTQVLLVPTFHGPDRGDAHKAGDIVRNRLADAFHNKGVRVISAGEVANWLVKSGYDEDMVLLPAERQEIAHHFRADEEVFGTVAHDSAGYLVEARIVLPRDPRMMQPLSERGPNLEQAAEAVARDAVAARGQMIPLRECENNVRAHKYDAAIADAARGIVAYPWATLARICLLSAVNQLPGQHTDSIVNVARTVLGVSPADPLALEYLATALDERGDAAGAGDAWVRLLATDSLNENLIRRVVDALMREGNATQAEPIIVRGSKAFPTDLELLKLRWLVHLATRNWKDAIVVGEELRAKDEASQVDPDFYRRLASAYRSDSQPVRALAVAAVGVSKFEDSAPLYSLYVQLLRDENTDALPRGLMQFPQDADLHALAAQTLQEQGSVPQAAAEMKRALAANPRLPHGWIQLADLQMKLNQPDSGLASLSQALANGEPKATVAQFALARGNALYTAANGTQQRGDFERAHRFLALAEKLAPSPQAAFLLGASALSVSQLAATEAPTTKSCALVQLADSSLTEAQANLVTGREVAPDAAENFLDYALTLRPYLDSQLKALCPGTGSH
jgi:tetratricopeptide (TPR) repeat protein